MNTNTKRVYVPTCQEIAACHEEAVHASVRINQTQADEVDMPQAIQHGKAPDRPCRVCEVAGATGDDGLCEGCRGHRILRRLRWTSHPTSG
jgi:hypothetical protein